MLSIPFNDFFNQNRRVDWHRHSADQWLANHALVCQIAVQNGKKWIAEVQGRLFRRVSDDRNLICAWDHVAACSGLTPGLDGETIESLQALNKYEWIRGLSRFIRDGDWAHGETRVVQVPKKSRKGCRSIHIANLQDRIVQRAVVQVLQPLLDPQFTSSSFGYRPAIGRAHALAVAEQHVMSLNDVVVVEDLADAFECVPQQRLMNVVRRYLVEPQIVNLVQKVVVTPGGMGLRQGGSLSSLLLNLYLHHLLDRKWQKLKTAPHLVRYADDIALFCRSDAQAVSSRARLDRLIRSAGFMLKQSNTSTIYDLCRRKAVDWLGYRIRHSGDRLGISISPASWDQLAANIKDAALRPNAELAAHQSARGWIEQQGPAWLDEDWMSCVRRIGELFESAGGQGNGITRELAVHWQHAYGRWAHLRREMNPEIEVA